MWEIYFYSINGSSDDEAMDDLDLSIVTFLLFQEMHQVFRDVPNYSSLL